VVRSVKQGMPLEEVFEKIGLAKTSTVGWCGRPSKRPSFGRLIGMAGSARAQARWATRRHAAPG
jgi:hypothetical protein